MWPALIRALAPAVSSRAVTTVAPRTLVSPAGSQVAVRGGANAVNFNVPNMNFNGGNIPLTAATLATGAVGVGQMMDEAMSRVPQVDGWTGETVNTRATPVANTVAVARNPSTSTTSASTNDTLRALAGVENAMGGGNPAPQFSTFNGNSVTDGLGLDTPLYQYQPPASQFSSHNTESHTAGLGLNKPLYQYKQPTRATHAQSNSAPVARNNAIRSTAYQGGLPPNGVRPYNVVPTVSMQPTANGGTQFNLNQRTLQYAGDPDYQRLYQLREAQATTSSGSRNGLR